MKGFSIERWKQIALTCLLILSTSALGFAQDGGNATNANQGLGTIFAETLRNLVNNGNFTEFAPSGQSARPASVDADEEELFTLNFNNAPIDQVLRFISDLKNKVVLKSDDVSAQIDIINPNEVNRDTAMSIIEEAFQLKGFSIIESEHMIVVLPTSVARQRGIELRDPADAGSRVVRHVVTLQHAQPTQLRDALQPLISSDASILADDRTQQLIITDTASNIQSLTAIIRELDREGVASVEVRVFRLRYLDANEMARNLGNLIGNIASGGAASTDRRGRPVMPGNIEIMADRTTNSLIITAPPDAIEEVAQFIERLDVSRSQNMITKTFTLQNGTASEVAQQLQQLAQSLVTGNYRPSVTADNRTNTIIVFAYQEDVDAVAELVQLLDSKQSTERSIEIFMLEHSDAVILKDLVESLVNQQGTISQNMPWWQRQQMQQGGGQITVIADQRLNALVVTARPGDIPMVRRVIDRLDIPQPYSAEEPRIFPVKFQRATDLASLINELFDSSRTTSGPFWQQQQQQTELTNLSGKVRVLPDQTTNSLLVLASTPRAFEVVERLVAQLDNISPEFGSTRVFNLRNANAESLADQLNALFETDPRQQQQQQGFFAFQTQTARQQQSQISNLIGNVRIVAETRTNSLMVTTSSQYFDIIESLVADLDREIAQVLVEILIVEITDFDQQQLGINWADNIPISVEGELSAPLSDIRTSRAAILGQSRFSVVLDFLARNDRVNVLARPDILTGDNQTAFVEVIERFAFPSGTTISAGVSQTSYDWEEVGLKLTVQPHINDHNMVTIDVDLETGQISERLTLDLGNGGRIPGTSRRTVQTRLTINDQETAVLSGVIDSTWRDSVEGVPGLKDIPILGYLFKSRGREHTKKEMVAFITPYILSSQEDRVGIYERRQNRLEQYEGFRDQILDLDVQHGVQNGSPR